MAQNVGELYEDYILNKRMKEIPVPTKDIDVMKYLRKLNEPICLFGEDPKDRKDRLRKILVDHMAVSISGEEKEPSTIPKFEEGDESVVEMKKFLITFSAPRAKERKEKERPITEERIKETNEKGQIYHDYVSTASDHGDKRILSALASRGEYFMLGSLSGCVNLWNISSMNKECDFEGHTDRITGVCFINDDLVASSSSDKTVKIWRKDGVHINFDFPCPVTSLCSHPSELFLIVGLSDGNISVIDIPNEKIIVTMKSNDGSVHSVSSHRDGGLVYAGGNDSVGRLWDLRSCRAVKTMIGHTGRITCSSFDENYHCITGAIDNTAIIWDLRNLNRTQKIAAHNAPLSSVSINGDILLTSSLDAKLKIWSLLDFRTYAVLQDSPSSIMKSCFSGNDGETIITAYKDGMWRLYTKPLF